LYDEGPRIPHHEKGRNIRRTGANGPPVVNGAGRWEEEEEEEEDEGEGEGASIDKKGIFY
jgi:hypothetical protein